MSEIKKQIKNFNLLTQVVVNSDNLLVQRDNGTTFRVHISDLPFLNIVDGTGGGSTLINVIQYGADYSAYYTDRSLVDKAYVDNSGINLINYSSANGINLTSEQNISLTANTSINIEITNPDADELNIKANGGLLTMESNGGGIFLQDLGGGGIFIKDAEGGGIYIQNDMNTGDGMYFQNYSGGGIYLTSHPQTNGTVSASVEVSDSRGVILDSSIAVKCNKDFEISNLNNGIILKSPDGTRYRITVQNGGALSVNAV
jgi:hypothetical protein